MAKPSPKRIAKMFEPPDEETIRETRIMIKEDEATSTKEEWERYVAPSHRSTPDTLFSSPPERFIAKLRAMQGFFF